MKTIVSIRFDAAFLSLLLAVLTACGGSGYGGDSGGGGGGGGGGYTVGGTVTGLTGSGLVLQNNGGHDLGISADGSFTFTTRQAYGTAYAVTVKTQPSAPPQNCMVTNGSGTVGAVNVTDVAVACTNLPTFSVGGTVTGLAGSGLTLQNNAGDDLSIAADGSFTFSTEVASGTAYSVGVVTQPSPQRRIVW